MFAYVGEIVFSHSRSMSLNVEFIVKFEVVVSYNKIYDFGNITDFHRGKTIFYNKDFACFYAIRVLDATV